MKRRTRSPGWVCALLAAFAVPAIAIAEPHDGEWHVDGELYLWGAKGELRSSEGQAVQVDFERALSDLEMAFMGTLGARKDRWSWFGDLMFIGIDATETVPATIPGVPTPTDARVSIEQDLFIVTLGGGYELSSTSDSNIDFVGGVRYFDTDTEVMVDLGGGLSDAVQDSVDAFDFVVGIKGRTGLAHNWFMTYYADVGGGDSELTWQALVDFNYQFSNFSAGAGYRILEWQPKSGGYLNSFQVSRPFAGVAFRFK